MQIQGTDPSQLLTPMLPRDTPPTAPASGTSPTDQQSTDATITASDALGNETTFLQLLVAQIQNQDPTAPMDSSTFLSQLASFTQVEQLIGIRQDVQELDPATTGSTSSTSSTTGS
jgi:flagellar basal-body rod modification protein FlgD